MRFQHELHREDSEMSNSQPTQPDRNLALELARATEAAALSAARWMGRGNKEGSDQAAVDALRTTLHRIEMDGVPSSARGEGRSADALYYEQVGSGSTRRSISVDPIDGTRPLEWYAECVRVVALSERGTMHYPPHIAYRKRSRLARLPTRSTLSDPSRRT